MTSNNPFTHPIDHLLRRFAYGEVTITQYITVHCDGDTCRDWRPMPSLAFSPSPWESAEAYEKKFDWLVEQEEESRRCQGHLAQHEKLCGMLRSFSYKPESSDRSRDGSLSITVLPWDAVSERLTSSRVIRARVFDYTIPYGPGTSSLYVLDGYGSNALHIDFRQWRPDDARSVR